MPEQKHDDFKELLVGLTRVETKLDTLGNVKDVAIEAQQSAKSAHLRIDRLDKLVFWIGTTVVVLNLIGYQTIDDKITNDLVAVITGAFTLYMAWKNNYLSNKGLQQKDVLQKNNLH